MTSEHRAVQWLRVYHGRFPGAWEGYARLMLNPPFHWPSWCWMPLSGTYAVLSGGGQNRCTPAQAAEVGPLGGLAAWRATQGIYRLHPTLLRELLDTPVTGDLPSEVLTRLPEWCVYVETPGHASPYGPEVAMHGFFAFLEHDEEKQRAELRLLIDDGLTDQFGSFAHSQSIIHLGGTLADGMYSAMRENNPRLVEKPRGGVLEQRLFDWFGGLLSVLLYLCADEAEIEERRPAPPPKVVKGKKRPIVPSARVPIVHACGVRIGAALDLARERASSDAPGDPTGRTVLPHVRRAHWHRYWMGPRDGERRVALRWLSPILVGLDEVPNEATVRPVHDA